MVRESDASRRGEETQDVSPKTEKKRRDILNFSLQVFADEGFREADVQVIADLAGVGKGTVYRHFGNKENLFLATARYCVEQLSHFVLHQLGGEAAAERLASEVGVIETLRRIASAVALFYQQSPRAVEMMIQERAEFRTSVFPTHLMHRAETRQGVDELIESAVAAGEIRAIDPRRATDALADLIHGSVINGCLEGDKAAIVGRVENAVDIFLRGLLPETPRRPARKEDLPGAKTKKR